MRISPSSERAGRARPEKRKVAANLSGTPFSAYLERDELRKSRERGRRRTLVISIGVHVVALLGLLIYSAFEVDELFGPSVEVKVMRASQLPPGVRSPAPPPAPEPILP